MRFSIRPEVEGGQGRVEIRGKRQVELEEKNEILPGVSLNKTKKKAIGLEKREQFNFVGKRLLASLPSGTIWFYERRLSKPTVTVHMAQLDTCSLYPDGSATEFVTFFCYSDFFKNCCSAFCP